MPRNDIRRSVFAPATRPVSFGMLGTYPPTQCGLASFASALRRSLLDGRRGSEVGMVRMLDAADPPTRDRAVAAHRRR